MKRQLSLIGIATLVLSLAGCPFKKRQPPVPQQAQAPTVQAPEPAPTPPPQPPAETQPTAPPVEAQPEKTETIVETPKPKKKPSPKKPATSSQGQQQSQAAAPVPAPAPAAPPNQTSKLIIQEGSAPSSQGQRAAGVGLEDSSQRSKQTTEQLLQSTQANLNSINRPLSPEEQAMVAQIKDYMAQSVKATKESDTVRAHNLALKARLLSDELVKH